MIDLTPDLLETCYELLKTTQPFCNWNLPEGEDVKFVVAKKMRGMTAADYQWNGNQHVITLSAAAVGYLSTLMALMAHEMIHLYLEEMGWEGNGPSTLHNAAFKKLAMLVCECHGFDLRDFY